MEKIMFLALGVILAALDYRDKKIPNVIVLPAIVIGCLYTGNFFWTFAMLSIGAILYEMKAWGGGDVKLLTMIGAYLGWYALIIFIISSAILLVLNRWHKGVAYAPYAIGTSIGMLLICG